MGRYLVLGTLGEGGMGVVHAAYDPELDRKVALKVLLPGRGGRAKGHERLLREAQSLARLSHPNVVAVHDVGTHEGRVFVAMEFIAGTTLSATIESQRPGLEAIVGLYAAAGRGLEAAHRVGLVHRDFKPDNVMVDREGRVRVVDFGLAQAVAEASAEESSQGSAVGLTATGALMGTPAYMAPEQFQGRPTDARTDVFAFCVALYEHLHGERPFAGETLVTLAAEVTAGRVREAPRGARVPKAIRRVLMKGLALAPEGRYPSMSALLADLDEAVRAPRRRRAALGVGAALAATIGAGSAFVLAEDDALARCQQSSAMIGEVWSPAAREAGARAFAATGLPYAADAWSRAEARLDGWAKGWAAARDGACVDGAEAGFSAALRDRRLACFDRQRARVEALVEVLAGADVKLVERTGELVDGLPGPRECSAAVMASAGDGPAAPTEAQAAAVEGLRRRLAAASTRFAATFGEAEVAAIEALVMEARGLRGEREGAERGGDPARLARRRGRSAGRAGARRSHPRVDRRRGLARAGVGVRVARRGAPPRRARRGGGGAGGAGAA